MITQDVDRCPVCGLRTPEPGHEYCSADCLRTAYNFRKRIMLEKRFLEKMGFTCTYESPVLLSIKIPHRLQFAYPESVHRFEFPDSALVKPSPQLANGRNLWQVIGAYMGTFVGDYLRWQYERVAYPYPIMRELLESTVKTALFEGITSFKCETCNRRFVRSLNSRCGDVCADHVVSNPVPF